MPEDLSCRSLLVAIFLENFNFEHISHIFLGLILLNLNK